MNERHRHRYEVNNNYVKELIMAGLTVSSRTTREKLCEIIELSKEDHPWFLAVSFIQNLHQTLKMPIRYFYRF